MKEKRCLYSVVNSCQAPPKVTPNFETSPSSFVQKRVCRLVVWLLDGNVAQHADAGSYKLTTNFRLRVLVPQAELGIASLIPAVKLEPGIVTEGGKGEGGGGGGGEDMHIWVPCTASVCWLHYYTMQVYVVY